MRIDPSMTKKKLSLADYSRLGAVQDMCQQALMLIRFFEQEVLGCELVDMSKADMNAVERLKSGFSGILDQAEDLELLVQEGETTVHQTIYKVVELDPGEEDNDESDSDEDEG